MRSAKSLRIFRKVAATLSQWCRSTMLPHGQIMWAKIILQLSEGLSPTDVATAQRTTAKTVHRWRNRFEAEGIDGLLERPRSGRPTVIDKATVDKVMFLTTKRIPAEARHWSIELMARYAEVTPWQVRQIWKASDLRPHRLKAFKISTDPAFGDKAVDIVDLYMNPPDNAVVLSVDEKTQIQALYAAFNTLSGKVIGKVTDKTNGKECWSFLKLLNRRTSAGKELHIILDNLSAHKTPAVRDWLEAHPRIHLHFTPTSSSWLNAVEGWFAQLERRALYRGIFTSVAELKVELRRFIEVHNEHSAKPFKWTKPAGNMIAAVGCANRALQN